MAMAAAAAIVGLGNFSYISTVETWKRGPVSRGGWMKCSSYPASSSNSVVAVAARLPVVALARKFEEEASSELEECELVSGIDVTLGQDMDASFPAHFVKAVKNNNGTGVLLLSDVYGFDDPETKDFAYRLACFGYNVLVPDLFRGRAWRKHRNKTEFDEWRATHPPERVAKDIDVSAQWLLEEVASSPNKLGLIGFCYGGGRALESLARNNVFGAAVCFYATKFDPSLPSRITAPVLFIAGDNDPLCPVDVVKKTEKSGNTFHVSIYPDRGHGFAHRPQSPEEDEDAEDAFSKMRSWLQNHLEIHVSQRE